MPNIFLILVQQIKLLHQLVKNLDGKILNQDFLKELKMPMITALQPLGTKI